MSKFCKDCFHFVPFTQGTGIDRLRLAYCDAARQIDLVTGEEESKFCRNERDLLGSCGADAKLFQPKDMPLKEQLVRSLDETPIAGTVMQ